MCHVGTAEAFGDNGQHRLAPVDDCIPYPEAGFESGIKGDSYRIGLFFGLF